MDACLSSHLVAFSSYVFFPLENPLFCILDSFSTECWQIPLLSRFLGLISTASWQIGWSIEPKSLCLLDTSSTDSWSIEVGFFSIDSWHLLDWSRYPCMHFIFLCFAFFFFVSISSCFSFSCRSIVPCSPHSLYISFLSVFGEVFFGLLCPLTIMSKRGRILRIECHSSGGVIDLGGELHVKGKKVFDVTNLGGKLVWYTLILIYILCHVSFGFVTIYIHHVLFLYLMMIYVFHSLSHTCFFFSLYTHVSCLFNLSLFSTWYMDVFFLVPFRKDKLKPSQDSEPSSCNNFQGSNLLD